MSQTIHDRTLALAGIFQAARLVQHIATGGQCDAALLEKSINSILNTDPKDTEAVFGGIQDLKIGLELAVSQFDGTNKNRDIELTKYVLSILYLERKLAKQTTLLDTISQGVERANEKLLHFPCTHSNLLASLADTYSNTVSTLVPRIIVHGDQNYLSNPENANKIRALLLSGIRAAVLWSQCGGSRFQLLFQRSKFVNEAKDILKTITS